MHSVAANALDLRASTVRERTFYESRWPAVLWLILAGLMFASAWTMPMTRTQEARVLVTARETLESGTLEGWLIPRANGEVRLQKPPLAYWLSAASFKLFGINEAAGRLPMVLFAWLTVGLTYDLARRLLSTRAAFYAAAGMGASMLFWRFANHAETDGLAMFFVTLAVYAIWRAWLIELKGAKRGGSTIWLHVSAVAMALSGLSKGPPVVFPLMFLACFSWAAWRWDLLARFFTRGAFITLLVIVAPWFLYILANHSSGVIKEELAGLAKGKGHVKGPLYHFIALLIATLPWTPLVVGGVVIAVRQWQGYVRMRGLLLWIGCMLIPLSLPSQKQDHYLLPILPPVFMLMGHLLDRALSGIDAGLRRGSEWMLQGAVSVGLAGSATPLIIARLGRGYLASEDLAVALACLALMLWPTIVFRLRGLEPGFIAGAIGGAGMMGIIVGLWAPTLSPDTDQPVAREIRSRFGDRKVAFFEHPNLSLCWELRGVFPVHKDLAGAAAAIQSDPKTVLLVEQRESHPPPALPGAKLLHRIEKDEKSLDFYGRGDRAP